MRHLLSRLKQVLFFTVSPCFISPPVAGMAPPGSSPYPCLISRTTAIPPDCPLYSNGKQPNSTCGPSCPRLSSIAGHADDKAAPRFTKSRVVCIDGPVDDLSGENDGQSRSRGPSPSQLAHLRIGQEPFALPLAVLRRQPARIAGIRDLPPVIRRVANPRQRVHRLACHHRLRAQAMVELCHPGAPDGERRLPAEARQDLLLDDAPAGTGRGRTTS